MALWKPFRGNRAALEAVEKHDGYTYFCVDDGSLFFDYTDAEGNLQRKQINAKDAETLTGLSLDEIKSQIENDLSPDTTLTQEGKAADAKATGEAISQKSQVQMITSETSEILSTLKIHKISQEEYDQAFEAGTLEDNAIYLTPDSEDDLKSQIKLIKTDEEKVLSTLEIHEVTQLEYDQMLTEGKIKADAIYLTPEEDDQKSQIQIITWEEND